MNPIVELCVHGEAKPHLHWLSSRLSTDCPGGRVLEQAIIIERDENGKWPSEVCETLGKALIDGWQEGTIRFNSLLDALASAQENQR